MIKQTIHHCIPACLIAGVLSSSVFATDLRVLSAEEAPNYFNYPAPTKQLDDDVVLQKSHTDIYLELLPRGKKQPRSLFKPKRRSQFRGHNKPTTDSPIPLISTMSLATGYTPLCSTLNINTAYNLNGTATGGVYCYHFEVTERAKTDAFLVNQAAGTDFTLTLLRHEDDGAFTNLGASNLAGNADENVLALTEYGQYYWLLNANSSNGSAITFGATVNTAVDDYELNDTPAMATVLADGRNVVYGNMDSASDVDYFLFTSIRGQNVEIELDGLYGNNEWIIEMWNGGWTLITGRARLTLSAPGDIYARVRPNPSVSVNPSNEYALTFGSIIDHISGVNVRGETNLERINYSPYLVTQVHNLLQWSVTVYDSSNEPLSGVTASFTMGTEDIPATTYTAISGLGGTAGGMITLPDCQGDYTVYQNGWLSRFDVGAWLMTFDEAMLEGEVGVSSVYLGHICKQTLY